MEKPFFHSMALNTPSVWVFSSFLSYIRYLFYLIFVSKTILNNNNKNNNNNNNNNNNKNITNISADFKSVFAAFFHYVMYFLWYFSLKNKNKKRWSFLSASATGSSLHCNRPKNCFLWLSRHIRKKYFVKVIVQRVFIQ